MPLGSHPPSSTLRRAPPLWPLGASRSPIPTSTCSTLRPRPRIQSVALGEHGAGLVTIVSSLNPLVSALHPIPTLTAKPSRQLPSALPHPAPQSSFRPTMSTPALQSPFPPVRRVVTGHTTSGKSVVVADQVQPIRPEILCFDLHYSGTLPPLNPVGEDFVDEIKDHPGVPPEPNACSFRAWDFAPGSVTLVHRTISMDYGVLLKGSIVLELDDGKRVSLREGDTVVQRGTLHTWRNESAEWTRIMFMMIAAKPIEIGGSELKEQFTPAE
ncbi:Cupin-2 domain-containing protein [Mycena kentingensis (nom. inval.)]|nr:Cupin-2 domain-containing protein [Mycena kentingensis (nom. inval.)]